jgi:hypothetical protein
MYANYSVEFRIEMMRLTPLVESSVGRGRGGGCDEAGVCGVLADPVFKQIISNYKYF